MAVLLEKVLFKNDFELFSKKIFSKGDFFVFRPITLLVGDQGTGKSTLLNILSKKNVTAKTRRKDLIEIFSNGSFEYLKFDFEKNNPRGKSELPNENFIEGLKSRWISHGEFVLSLLTDIPLGDKNKIILMDEPDMALSIRSAYKLVSIFKDWAEKGNQVIAAVHNPIVIQGIGKVLSLEHNQWMSSDVFIKSQTP